ncbi:recombinase family protein [Azospirillum sp. sgz302134]
MGLKIGYAYGAKSGPSLDEQRVALTAAGVHPDRVYADDFVPARKPRQWLPEFIRALRPGDIAVFPALDVLGTNRAEAVKVLRQLAVRGVGIEVIDGGVSAAPEQAGPVFALVEAFAAAEARWNRAQWEPGLKAARQRAVGGGRKPKLHGTKRTATRALYFDLDRSIEEVEEFSGCSRTTLWRDNGPRTRQPGESLADFRARQQGKLAWKPKRRRPASA